ncbi:MAG: ABC transporter ATP-binding protein [Verrucomicrobia bacterium]|nr:ABC transporter ATP-binding protein [Verrucomicrobiota bacterium]
MSDDVIIRVEGLGKKYRISHQGERQRYVALRDVIAEKAVCFFKKLKSGKPDNLKSGDTTKLISEFQNVSVSEFKDISASQHFSVSRTEEFWALRAINFEVRQGEVVGIIGRNGAGKSTLLKILSRITEPTEGRVKVRGRIASLLEVGTGFHPELTGRENIFLNGAILGMSRVEIRKKFDEMVAFAEVEKFLDTPVKRYSSGMYVRLAFAVAAHLEPEILIVDEVLAVGDAEFQKKCLGKMQTVAGKEGRTVLFVSHNMPMVESLCGRIVMLEWGRLKQEGPPDQIIPLYLQQGVANSPGAGDLRTHPGRRNSREPAVVRVWLETADHRGVDNVVMGQPVYFCFEFKCSSPVASPIFGFGIEDSMGRRVFSLNNLMTGNRTCTPEFAVQGVARLYVPQNPLLPGSYFLSVSLMEDVHAWVDFVEQALAFTVEPADVYGTGRIPQSNHGAIYINGDILVEPTPSSCPPIVTAGQAE